MWYLIVSIPDLCTLAYFVVESHLCHIALLDERLVVDRHLCHIAAKFSVFDYDDHDKLHALYCLPKLHKGHINSILLLIQVYVLLLCRVVYKFDSLPHCD